MAHDKLAHGMALSSHIRLGNHEFTRIDGLTLIAGFYPIQALHAGSMDPMVGSRSKQHLCHRRDMADQGTHKQ